MAAATLVTTLGRPKAEGGPHLNAPIVLGSTYRAEGGIAYGRDGNPTVAALEEALGEDVDDLWQDFERALDR